MVISSLQNFLTMMPPINSVSFSQTHAYGTGSTNLYSLLHSQNRYRLLSMLAPKHKRSEYLAEILGVGLYDIKIKIHQACFAAMKCTAYKQNNQLKILKQH
jgi:NAD-dependent oxidoreductase involved in siderophore biosynthesis